MKKLYNYLVTIVTIMTMAACTQKDVEEPVIVTSPLQFLISEYPYYEESRAVGIPDNGRLKWITGDEILVKITPEIGDVQCLSLIYDANGIWNKSKSIELLDDVGFTIQAWYAPAYEWCNNELVLKEGMQAGAEEFIEGECTVNGYKVKITFDGKKRAYSRLRIAGPRNSVITVTTSGFTPNYGELPLGGVYILKTNEDGNAFLYVTWVAEATFEIKDEAGKLLAYRVLRKKSDPNKGASVDATIPIFLPKGVDLNKYLIEVLGDLKKIRFIANSDKTSDNILFSDKENNMDAYVVVTDDGWLEIHTIAGNFVASEDCSEMFYNLRQVTDIDLGDNFNTSNVMNMNSMFGGCRALVSLKFGNKFDTSSVTNMEGMFGDCWSITHLDLSVFNTSNVIEMRGMFGNCESLTSIDLSNFNTSNVTDMRQMFSYCKSLSSLDVSNFDTSKVKDMRLMFSNCESLVSLDISNFDISNLTSLKGMFQECSSLVSLNVSHINTSNIVDMSHLFCNCQSLKSLNVSNFNTSNVTNMMCMFSSCKSLTSLDISNFDTSNVINMSGMFSGLYSLSTLDLTNLDTSNVTDMSGMFGGCNFSTIDLSNLNTSKVTNMSGMFNGTSITSTLDLSSFDTSNVTDMSDMFNVASISGPLDLSTFNTSKVTNMSAMFDFIKISSLNISNFDTSNVTDMSSMFRGYSLSTLDLSHFNTSKVTNMNKMFESSILSSVNVSSFNTSKVTNMNLMFGYCYNLIGLNLTNFTFSNLVNVDMMLYSLGRNVYNATGTKILIYVTNAGYNYLMNNHGYQNGEPNSKLEII